MHLGELQEGHQAPRRLVGEPDEADLAIRDQRAERIEDVVDRVGVAGQAHIFEPLENAHGAVRPMELIDVDVIRLEPRQALVDCLIDLRCALPGQNRVVAQPIDHGATARDLRGDQHLVPCLAAREPCANDLLGTPLRLGLRRNRIDLGSVEDVDAPSKGVVHLRVALGLGVLLAIGHGAQAERAHLHAGPAKLPVLHHPSFRLRLGSRLPNS